MKTESARAAQAIKKELKAKFPTINFSVKSSNFSGGNSVDIRYSDGIPCSEVQAITNKYQYGHFNGMEDIYEYNNPNKDIPQAKYVHVQRDISEDNNQKIVTAIMSEYGLTEWNDEICMKMFSCWKEQKIWKEAQNLSFIS